MSKAVMWIGLVGVCFGILFFSPVVFAERGAAPPPVLPNAGPAGSVEPTIGEFDRVAITGPFEVEVALGERRLVRVDAERRILEFVEVVVIDGTLQVRPQAKHPAYVFTGRRVFVRIVTPRLRGLSAAGSAKVNCTGVHADTFSLQQAGSGEILVAGQVGTLTVQSAGSGAVDAGQLRANAAAVSLAGSGEVRVAVGERVTGSLFGSGDLVCLGNAKVEVVINGSGKIRREP